MEVVIAVIRPKPNVITQDYRARLYDILLLDSKTPPGEKVKQSKYLPMLSMNIIEEEPRELVLSHLYKITGAGESGAGIKGERAIQIPCNDQVDLRIQQRESLSRFSLFFVAVNSHDKLNKTFVDQAQHTPGFYQLDYVLEVLNNGSVNFPSPTRSLLAHLERWLHDKHSRPGAAEFLFSQRTDFRIRLTVHNPVFIPSRLAHQNDGSNISDLPTDFQMTANEALAKMLSIEKCDIVKMNPLFGSGLSYVTKANMVVTNKFWDQGIVLPGLRTPSVMEEPKWCDKYPVHDKAAEGDIDGIKALIQRGQHHSKKDSISWAPIHYGAWYGKTDVVSVLLDLGCSPNVSNNNGYTPLHMAAQKGYPLVAKSLLLHRGINVNAKDSSGRTALDICSQAPDRDRRHEEVLQYIREAQMRPSMTIEIFLMDKSSKQLRLPSGHDTTVHQLCLLMLEEFGLPQGTYLDIFTIWTCSPSLQLQLKPDHKPTRELENWNKRTVHMLAGARDEKPVLKWRRNAKISVDREKQLLHPEAIKMLFHEAYDNYINALYPCKDHDVLIFSAILFCIYFGERESSTAKTLLSNERYMKQLVPAVVLKAKGPLINKILKEYNNRDQVIGRERSTFALQKKFISHCHQLTVYGSAFFDGKFIHQTQRTPRSETNVACHIGVNDVGLHIINAQTKVMIHSYTYPEMKGWHEEEFVLEIHILKPESRSRRQQTNIMKIRTKQAGLIVNLMDKMVQMHYQSRNR
ncbi:hypothetical protein LOTGIDRAFT_174957 [Lottia gigantea]|uniref:FERM domain-containing protein n=1 Tax=Lottia gigantea TaxID=225164 RepID=V3ZXG2_LOTGI|nr:hypothetical protein LOTGIDRAFT_174957 [Lottia gigantea]ESO96223.1 hypothetical protein LOTGIDRAFT_174957 [Lottia gigantea]